MAYIERLKTGWRVCYREAGKKRYLTDHAGKPLGSKPMAELALARAQLLEDAGRRRRASAVLRMTEIVERWQKAKLSGPAPNDTWTTENSAGRVLAHCRAMTWESPEDITPGEIARWRASPPRVGVTKQTPSTSKAGTLLRAVLWWAKDTLEQPVSEATLAALRPPRTTRRPKAALLSDEQVEAALEEANAWGSNVAALVRCLSLYGWRPITAARMVVGDLVGDQITCRVKGGHVVVHALLDESALALAQISEGRPATDPLFIDPRTGRGWPLHNHAITHWMIANLGLHSYDIKRYGISRLVSIMPAHEAMQFTGHLTATQIMKYARSNEDRQRESLSKLAAELGRSGAARAKLGGSVSRPDDKKDVKNNGIKHG